MQNIIFYLAKPMLLQPEKHDFRAFQRDKKRVKVDNKYAMGL